MSNTRKYLRSFLLLLIMSSSMVLKGQSHGNMPYSIFGIGELSPKGFGRSLALGKTGLALASDQFISNLNPASYFLLDSISFFFNVGLKNEFLHYKTNTVKQNGMNLNLNNLALGFRITGFWATGVGIAPYSDVDYKILYTDYVEGNTDKYIVEMTGTGGLSRFYWDNSFHLKNLSVGISVNYLFGNIQRNERKVYSKINSELNYNVSSYYDKLYLDFGIQYRLPVSEKLSLTLGGVYGDRHNLDFKQEVRITDENGSEIENKLVKTGTFRFPFHAGGGFALNYDKKLTVTADYLFHRWDETASSNSFFQYRNTNTFRFGVEYLPAGDRIGSFPGMIRYMAGFYTEQSYLEIEGKQSKDNGITLGLSFPFLQNRTTINLAVMAGKYGGVEMGLIEKRYARIVLNMQLHDWWFLKAQYD